jgi:Na+/proline symporter
VVSSVLLGGSAAISALTGINGNSALLRAIFYRDSLCLLHSVRGAVCISVLSDTHCLTDSLTFRWLLPASVAAYTLRGGLRATILTDYLHTAIILIVILMFWFSVYVTGNKIGSPDAMYNLLQAAQVRNHNAPTKDNSYVTIRSL